MGSGWRLESEAISGRESGPRSKSNGGAVPTLDPEAVSAQALAYIDDMWGGVTWLRDTEIVEIGQDDLLLRDGMFAYITANKESGEWDKAYGTDSPEEWIDAAYPKPKIL